MVAVQTLSYTLHKHTQRPLEVVPLHTADIPVPAPKDPRNAPRTPFSFQRFILPELGGHKRKTIYLDSDMVVFSDIGKLYDTPMGDADALAPAITPGRKDLRYAVLLMSAGCPWSAAEMIRRLDDGEVTYEQLMFEFNVPGKVEASLPYTWNSLELYEPGKTDLLHYTDMWLQPWLVRDNPLAAGWVELLCEAIDAGFVERDAVAEGVERRWARPSLLYQVDKRIFDPKKLPFWVTAKDIPFLRYARKNKYRLF